MMLFLKSQSRRTLCLTLVLAGGWISAGWAQTLDQYGGYTGLTGHNTSGYFRTEKIGDRWLLVTPSNHVFISRAFDTANFFDGWGGYCPPLNSYPNPYNNRANYNDNNAAWEAAVKTNMAAWGFNSLGAWCQDIASITENVTCLGMTWEALALGAPKIGRGFADVFDPRFAQAADQQAGSLAAQANDPYRIGAFPDNEIGWIGSNAWGPGLTLPEGFIALPASTSGKQYWAGTFLAGKYATVDDLNAAYGKSFTSFAGTEDTSVVNTTSLSNDPAHPAILADKTDFAEVIADWYYRISAEAMRQYDPNHLVFSTRWALFATAYDTNYPEHQACNERFWKKAGQYCDILAINTYWDNAVLESTYHLFSRMFAAGGKPIMVTEWCSNANDTQFANVSFWKDYQFQRGEFYGLQMKTLLDFKFPDPAGGAALHPIVGAQWFQYYDEAPLGRPDGEKVNWGLLNVKDEPYLTMVDVMATFNAQWYDYILNQQPLQVNEAPTPSSPAMPPAVASATASSFLPGWEPSKVIDGDYYTAWSTPLQSQTGQQYIRVNLEAPASIEAMIVVPRSFSDPNLSTFPVDFQIQYSADGSNWVGAPGHVYNNYPNPRGVEQYFAFSPPLVARAIRILGTKFGTDGSNYYMQIVEIKLRRSTLSPAQPVFQWSTLPGAMSYTLLYSPENCFPREQTIRVDNLTGTSYTPASPLPAGLWYWCIGSTDSARRCGKYSPPVAFRVPSCNTPVPPAVLLGFEDVSAWRNVSLEDGGWDGTVWAFRDSDQKTTGGASARVVFTMNSLNKATQQQNAQAGEIVWSAGSLRLFCPRADQVSFDVRTARATDRNGTMTVASKFIRLRVRDSAGSVIADAPIDPDGTLPPLMWQNQSCPLTTPHAREISSIEFYVDMSATSLKIPWDQRLTLWIDNLAFTPAIARADFDMDLDVDQSDFGHLQACLSGPNVTQDAPECVDAHLDTDDDVDGADLGIFQRCFSGPGVVANPTCAD